MKFWTRTVAAIVLAAGLTAQEKPRDLPGDWATVRGEMERALEAAATEDTAPDALPRQTRLLGEFLERWRDEAPASAPELIDARLRLGSLLLSGHECRSAATVFRDVLDEAPDDALDVRGRALYGLAQARVLAGDLRRGTALLQRVRDEFVGTRWSDHAIVAIELLTAAESTRSRVGDPAPDIGPRLDWNGRAQTLSRMRGDPVLLIVASTLDGGGLATARSWLSAARRAGLGEDRILLFAMGADTADGDQRARLERLFVVDAEPPDPTQDARVERPSPTILPAPAGFLDPDLLRYGVDALPTTVLVGPDGTLLSRDLPPERLESVLRELMR